MKDKIHTLECPKCNRISPYIYDTDMNKKGEYEMLEVFFCHIHGEFGIGEFGGIYFKKIKVIKQVSWKELKVHELGEIDNE